MRPLSLTERLTRERKKGAALGILAGLFLGVYLGELLRVRSAIPPFVVVSILALVGCAAFAIREVAFSREVR